MDTLVCDVDWSFGVIHNIDIVFTFVLEEVMNGYIIIEAKLDIYTDLASIILRKISIYPTHIINPKCIARATIPCWIATCGEH